MKLCASLEVRKMYVNGSQDYIQQTKQIYNQVFVLEDMVVAFGKPK